MLISEEFLLLVTTDEGKWLASSQAVPKDVLGKVAKGLGDELYDRLAAAGIVECRRGRFLRPNRFPVRNPAVRKQTMAAVTAATAASSVTTS
jgi:hypothetical protein